MKIRHTVIFNFYNTTTEEEISEVIDRLNNMGEYLINDLGVTNWIVTKHIPETFKDGRAHLLQDGVFPNIAALNSHANSETHRRVVEITPKVCDWMSIDTVVLDTD